MEKRIVILSVAFFFLFYCVALIPSNVYGQSSCLGVCPPDQRGGFVPCAKMCDDPDTLDNECDPCTLCHFFVMFDTILDFVFFTIVPVVAVLMIVISGAMFFFATGSPSTLETAKKALTSVVLGIIVVYSAFLIIGLFLMAIGLEKITWEPFFIGWWRNGLFEINCTMP